LAQETHSSPDRVDLKKALSRYIFKLSKTKDKEEKNLETNKREKILTKKGL
jgi:hypothetical protein